MQKTTITETDQKRIDSVIDELQRAGMYKKEIKHEERFKIALQRIAKGDLEDFVMTAVAQAAEVAAEMVDGDA